MTGRAGHIDEVSPGTATAMVGRGLQERGFFLMVLAICAVILSPTLAYRMGVDQGTYAYIAASLLERRWPYLATWDHQFPGGYFLHAGQIAIFGRSIVTFRVFDLFVQLLNVGLIYRIAQRVTSRETAYLAAAIYALVYQGYGPWNTGQREGFALALVLLAIRQGLTATRRPSLQTGTAIGVLLGLAATIKPTLLLFPVALAPLWRQILGPSWRLRVAVVSAGALAAVVPLLGFVLFYWWHGGLEAFYEAAVAYNVQVYIHRLRGDLPWWAYALAKTRQLGWHALGVAVVYPLFLWRKGERRIRATLYLGFLVTLATVWLQGTFAGYHFILGLAFGAILIADGFSCGVGLVLEAVATRIKVGRAATLVAAHAAVLLAVPFYVDRGRVRDLVTLEFLRPPAPNALRIGTVFDFAQDYELATYLRSRTTPADRLQIWGHESLVYYLADRTSSARFQTSNPLVMRVPGQSITPMQERWRQEFMVTLERRPPRYFVVTRQDNWWWAPEERTSEQLLDDFAELKRFIEREYVIEATIGRFLIYRYASHQGQFGARAVEGDGTPLAQRLPLCERVEALEAPCESTVDYSDTQPSARRLLVVLDA